MFRSDGDEMLQGAIDRDAEPTARSFQTKPKLGTWLGIGGAGVFLLVVLANVTPVSKPTGPEPFNPGAVVYDCQDAVREGLKDPDSARFAQDTWAAELYDDGTWLAAGEVSATNSFNARIRSIFACEGIYVQQTGLVKLTAVRER